MKKRFIIFFFVLVHLFFCQSLSIAEDSSVYIDQITGTSFIIPKDWQEVPLSAQREMLKAKFMPLSAELSDYATISYGVTDVWNNIPSDYTYGLTRADINNSIITSDDFKYIIGLHNTEHTTVSINDIDTISYNGREYFRFASESSGYGFTLPLIEMMHVDNGYAYCFIYIGSLDGRYYNDFKDLIRNISYKASSTIATNTTSKTSLYKAEALVPRYTNQSIKTINSDNRRYSPRLSKDDSGLRLVIYILGIALWALIPGFIAKKKGRNFHAYYCLSFLISPLISTIIVLCLRRKIPININQSDNHVDSATANRGNTTSEENEELAFIEQSYKTIEFRKIHNIKRCSKCGKIQSSRQLYCLKCRSPLTKDTNIYAKQGHTPKSIDYDTPERKMHRIKYCRYCGFELLEGSEFCSNCGKRVK